MLLLTDMQRAYLRKIRALSEDHQGNEVFAGLTLEESMRFFERVALGAGASDAGRRR
ncbi:hypothetical protein [Pseudomonas silesiensis]|uniref:hypothetical protein n=1 Tax=Pseudomonas silesiensis TaxID=1853130 RepID=UPI0013747A08|nr:hypothetical protein [Pseudomonas silesiensis]